MIINRPYFRAYMTYWRQTVVERFHPHLIIYLKDTPLKRKLINYLFVLHTAKSFKKINQHFSSYFALSKSIAFITSLILESLSQREQFHIRMTGIAFWSKFEKKFVENNVIMNLFTEVYIAPILFDELISFCTEI